MLATKQSCPAQVELDRAQRRTYPAGALQRFLEDLDELAGKCVTLPIGVIDLTTNIRGQIDTESEEFRVLSDQIKSHGGVLQYPVVTIINDDGQRRLVCLAGHRRVLAAKRAGSKKISVSVRATGSEKERLTIALSENLLREDLHALDIAKTMSRLHALGESREDLANRFGKNPKTVAQYIKMNDEWPSEALSLINRNREKFGASFLLRLARRRLSEAQVIEQIRNHLHSVSNSTKRPTKPDKIDELEAYFARRQLCARDRRLIEDALRELNVI